MIGDLLRERVQEITARRTTAEKKLEELQQRVSGFADDLDAISMGEKPPSGRTLCWAGDIAAALRGLLDEAVL